MQAPSASAYLAAGAGKIVAGEDAVRLIRRGATVATSGFVGIGFAEELANALEARFVASAAPRHLTPVDKAFPIHVALIRATTADPDDKLSMEREALTLESLSMAMAAHNSGGGIVIAQLERITERSALNPPQ